jgi:hypothetical protein
MTFVVNGTPAAQRWSNYDNETVLKGAPGGPQSVDHGRSAVENLKAAGKNMVDMVDPTNHFRDLNKNSSGDYGEAFKVLSIPWVLMGEVGDVIAGPLRVAKNLTDAAAHGILAGVDAITGKE